MKITKLRNIGVCLLAALWLALALTLWFGPRKEMSESERRRLAQAPALTAESVRSGKFMTAFESFTLDQFPLRDTFRRIKSLFHYNVLGQKDNNGIYVSNGFAAKQEYPLDEASLARAVDRFQYLYDAYLKESGSKITFALVPDKGQFLAPESGNLSLDYDAMEAVLQEGMPWAEFVPIRDTLELSAYYRTDTHWRQEALLPTAQTICDALGVGCFESEDVTPTALERPFYGVYYGQAALPMEPETMYLLENDLLKNCTVYDYESGKTSAVYNLDLLPGRDLYDVYLSGPRSLLTITNPSGIPGKELIVFRDSFGSSMVPLLIRDYETVTLVDIRYLQSAMLSRYVDFHGQDVLFLYSTLVMNHSESLK